MFFLFCVELIQDTLYDSSLLLVQLNVKFSFKIQKLFLLDQFYYFSVSDL